MLGIEVTSVTFTVSLLFLMFVLLVWWVIFPFKSAAGVLSSPH